MSNPQKKKILLVGTHTQQFTGYSKVTYNIVKFLASHKELDIVHFGFQRAREMPENYRPLPDNVYSIDATAGENPLEQGYGFKQLPDVIKMTRPDAIIIYNDSMITSLFIQSINERLSDEERSRYKLIVYLDQVHQRPRKIFLDLICKNASVIFAFTDGWKESLERHLSSTKTASIPRIRVLRHAHSPELFHEIEDKKEIRKELGFPEEAFLMLNLNRNNPRKRYDILIRAFVELICTHPHEEIYLICVCDSGEKGSGYSLFDIFSNELNKRNQSVDSFANRLMISNINMSLSDDEINRLYNSCDIGVTTSEGEGFGLCQLEQMSVGVPQVVPDILGLNEFCNNENSILVPANISYYVPLSMSTLGGEAQCVDPHDYYLALEKYVLDRNLLLIHSKAAKERAVSLKWEEELIPLYQEL
jgi:glycosyltransferase involved in cell wall biosynthesis